MQLKMLSGGAANGLVNKLHESFLEHTGLEIDGDFGAVGSMRERIEAGEHVDVAILTRAAINTLVKAGKLDPESVTDLGTVETGVGVISGRARPPIGDQTELTKVFGSADAIFCPDTKQATAGIHVASVLHRLGIAEDVPLMEYPNGQTAMAAMAKCDYSMPIGCTQVTEILNTEGVDYVGPLPAPYDLSTIYTAAIALDATYAEQARKLIAMLADPDNAQIRRSVGFT